MESKNRTQLEEAKAYFYAWRLVEAYNIFRRYFDRLPFKPEKEHAEYIGMFVRTLVELGKEYELKFYVSELEKWHERTRLPEVQYSLGVVYRYLNPPKLEACRALFEEIVKNPHAKSLHPKARMLLADYYMMKDDVASAHLIVNSIETSDLTTCTLVAIWKNFIAYREGKNDLAEQGLNEMFKNLTAEQDWYGFFSGKVIQALNYLDQKKLSQVKEILTEIRQLFSGRHFRTVQEQLQRLEGLLQKEETLGSVYITSGLNESTVAYRDKSFSLQNKDPRDKLLLLLLKKRFLEKSMIVKALYQRTYQGEVDDKLIYYHIHALRKRLKAVGLPSEAILNEENGYRWVPEVEIREGDL